MFLAAMERAEGYGREDRVFPWSLPWLRGLEGVQLRAAVTFLVGENGAGKSTLLEGMAAGMRAVAAGGRDLERDTTLEGAREMARAFRFVRRRHAKVRLFLRADDVFGFTNRVADDMRALAAAAAAAAEAFGREMPEGLGRRLAQGVVRGERLALACSYGENPDGRSHGETFLALLRRRLAPGGLYFLDEPETPLSPARVLALMAMLAQGVARGSQFVIATHSPILMALPGAAILEVGAGGVRETAWEEVEHVRVTRAFLAYPARVLRQVLEG
ncbi:MAG: AAA family ATPase [Alphaproteobacteria bacterium]|nr:AAA family ATPase [Alphaproteobacteria bacterium]